MADDRHYVGGQWYRICDRTGFKVRDVRTKKQWNNVIVREQSYEPRQPQDFVQGVMDDQTVTDPRPRSINVFIGPLTTVTTASLNIGDVLVPLQSSLRMLVGDTLWIMQGNGQNLVTQIVDVPTTTSVQIFPGINWPTPSNSEVTDVSAVSEPTFP